MRLLLPILVLILNACAQVPSGLSRKPAQEDDSAQKQIYQVGDIKVSLLSPKVFQEVHGNVWALLDGGVVVEGSELAGLTGLSKLPDARGAFLRMQNNGRSDGKQNPDNSALGHWQQFASVDHSHNHSGGDQMYGNGWQRYTVHSVGGVNPNSLSGEVRPNNITVNFYIKINSCRAGDQNCL